MKNTLYPGSGGLCALHGSRFRQILRWVMPRFTFTKCCDTKDSRTLELAFANKEFRDLCLNESLARQTFGEPLAERLKRRLADLAAASVVSDLLMLPGRPRELTNDRRGHMVMDLIDGQQLVFQGGHVKERVLQSGDIDWSRVRRVKILGLENGHE